MPRRRSGQLRPANPTALALLCLVIALPAAWAAEPGNGMAAAVLQPATQDICKLSGPIADSCCSFEDVNAYNEAVNPTVGDLVQTLFFRFWKVNLWKDCAFWKDGLFCSNRNCAVEPADESEVPDEWKSGPLGSVDLSGSSSEFSSVFGGCSITEKDFCIFDSETTQADGTLYVDLLKNPERFTGYSGEPANRIWRAIYDENCFNLLGDGTTPLETDLDRERAVEAACVEKRAFYRLVSGLHSSISTHICTEWLNRTSGEWQPNLDCFIHRVGKFPERVNNVYFNYAVVLRAIKKLEPYLRDYTFCSSNKTEDEHTRALLDKVLSHPLGCASTFNEKQLFAGQDSKKLMREIKGAFRNISRIMDCVSCDKCKMWGKLQVTGLGTALKILFSFGDNWRNFRLTRTEVVTLINSFHRYSLTLKNIGHFKQMAQERAEAALLAAEKAERSVDEKAEMEPAPVAEEPPQVGEPPVEETKEPNESIITANEPERTVEEPAGEKSGPVPIWVIRWLTSPSVVFLVVGASTFMLVLYVVLGTDDEAGQGGSPAKVTKKRTKSQKVN